MLNRSLEKEADQSSGIKAERYNTARLFLICASIFLVAFFVRLLYWQDILVQLERERPLLQSITRHHKARAESMLEGNGILFPNTAPDPSHPKLIIYTPGYPIFIATICKFISDSDSVLRCIQLIIDSISAVFVFLIAVELLPFVAAIIGGLLVAISPHFAFYSQLLIPDSISILPILLAIYFLVRASKRPRLMDVIKAGIFLGISCWLRPNALLLAPFLVLIFPIIFKCRKRLKYSIAFVTAALIIILPITIRNLILFHHFIPLSLGAGINMIEGIADYDKEKRFGYPASDDEVPQFDAKLHNRPDYGHHLWSPDGIERDKARLKHGLKTIRSNFVWFLRVMLSRSAFMLRYNNTEPYDWPENTAIAPIISKEPPFGHSLKDVTDIRTAWASSPAEMFDQGTIISSRAEVSLSIDGQVFKITGDDSEYGDQFASVPITVEKNSDYLLTLQVKPEQLRASAIKVTSEDRRTILASSMVDETEPIIKIPFATGSRPRVLIVFSNNGRDPARLPLQIGRAEIFSFGQTPYAWTRYARPLIRSIQKNLFTTPYLFPFNLVGIALLALARRGHELAFLLAVPIYYLFVQSVLHTEYRYILVIHYFLLPVGAATIYYLTSAVRLGIRYIEKTTKAQRRQRFLFLIFVFFVSLWFSLLSIISL